MDEKKNHRPGESLNPSAQNENPRNNKWEIISKEFIPNEYGKLILSKVVWQLKREFYLRLFSALAILGAIATIYFNLKAQRVQNAFQISQQKALAQFEIYTKCINNINILTADEDVDATFKNSQKEFEYENIPQIMLLGDTNLIREFNTLDDKVYFLRKVKEVFDSLRSIQQISRDEFRIMNGYYYHKEQKITDNNLTKLKIIQKNYFSKLENEIEIDSNKINRVIRLLPKKVSFVDINGAGRAYWNILGTMIGDLSTIQDEREGLTKSYLQLDSAKKQMINHQVSWDIEITHLVIEMNEILASERQILDISKEAILKRMIKTNRLLSEKK
ncbi:MAG TPA: hypothetical protein VGN20_15295 [Mucilaginibacter sp.]|jgi:hypothetical protein